MAFLGKADLFAAAAAISGVLCFAAAASSRNVILRIERERECAACEEKDEGARKTKEKERTSHNYAATFSETSVVPSAAAAYSNYNAHLVIGWLPAPVTCPGCTGVTRQCVPVRVCIV